MRRKKRIKYCLPYVLLEFEAHGHQCPIKLHDNAFSEAYIPIQIESVDLALSHTIMLNLFQHLKEIPKQVRDDNREQPTTLRVEK